MLFNILLEVVMTLACVDHDVGAKISGIQIVKPLFGKNIVIFKFVDV